VGLNGTVETAYRTEGWAQKAQDGCKRSESEELVECRGEDDPVGWEMGCRPKVGAANYMVRVSLKNALARRRPRLGGAGEWKARVMGQATTSTRLETRTSAPPRRGRG
jgi:hypothetical protein